jgi:hypothetical protein
MEVPHQGERERRQPPDAVNVLKLPYLVIWFGC